jgi:hypothetical protein
VGLSWVVTASGSVINQIFTRSKCIYKFLQYNGQNYPNRCVMDIKCLHHPLVVCIGKNIYTCKQGVGVGLGLNLVVTTSGSVI